MFFLNIIVGVWLKYKLLHLSLSAKPCKWGLAVFNDSPKHPYTTLHSRFYPNKTFIGRQYLQNNLAYSIIYLHEIYALLQGNVDGVVAGGVV